MRSAVQVQEDHSRAYREAIRRHVCTPCLDQADDGTCGLTGRVCAIEQHLPRLAEVLSAISSPRMDEYVAAVEAQICSRCPEQDAEGQCRLREGLGCSLYMYLAHVLDAIEEVNATV